MFTNRRLNESRFEQLLKQLYSQFGGGLVEKSTPTNK